VCSSDLIQRVMVKKFETNHYVSLIADASISILKDCLA
jgi:hypothetical protein